jgi:hypothetical protein
MQRELRLHGRLMARYPVPGPERLVGQQQHGQDYTQAALPARLDVTPRQQRQAQGQRRQGGQVGRPEEDEWRMGRHVVGREACRGTGSALREQPLYGLLPEAQFRRRPAGDALA